MWVEDHIDVTWCLVTLGTGGFPGIHMVGWGGGGVFVGDDNVLCTCTHGRCYATSWDGVGWGGVGDDNVPCTCTHGRCYATSSFLYLHTWSLLRNIMGWGGVGWGMITFLALAHMVGATQHHLSCTCTHGRCYATSWDGVGWGGVGDDNVPCTCTHGRCYATSTFLYLHTWSVLRNIMGWGGVGDDNVPCTCTHGRCYATSTFLYLHTWSLLRNIMGWGGVGWGMKFVKKDVTHSSWLQVTTVQKAFVQFRKNNWDAPIWILQWCETRLSTVIFWVHTS